MNSKPPHIGNRLQDWITARKRYHLSHAHVQMARELGMNPRKFGNLDNADQEPWKLPLPAFIELLYRKRFGKDRPDEGKRPSGYRPPRDLTDRPGPGYCNGDDGP